MHLVTTRTRPWHLVFASLLCAGTIALPRAVHANQYEAFIDIDTEEDLYDLKVANVIGDATFETLVDLLQRGVDLNSASRKTLYVLPNLTYAEVDAILAYRDEVGHIRNPAELVVQGVLRAERLEAIAAFLIIGGGPEGLPASGMARMQTQYSLEDTGAPASAIQLRAHGMQNATVGAVLLNTRLQIGEVRYDPARQAMSAEAPSDSLSLPKAFVQWEDKRFSVVAGTYRTGYGQRLTFDKTDHSDPDGFYGDSDVFRSSELTRDCKESQGELEGVTPCPASEGYTYVTPDYRSRDGLLGAAFSVHDLEIGAGTLEVQGFASYQPRNIYQYELYNRATCEDPRSDAAECSAPDIYRTAEDPLAPSSEYSFQTLPNMFAERIVGGNATYAIDRRAHIGVTGYGSHVDWLVDGLDLDFQEWSPMPYGGDFGAVGVDAAKGFGMTDVLAEVTRSFDGMPSGGGFGGLLRTITAWGKNEVEVSGRYYDENFANPHARPIAAADEFEGSRARDEIGGRVQYTGELDKRFRLRSNLDYWQSPSDSVNALSAFLRGDIKADDEITFGLWTQYQDRDLSRNGRGECYEGEETDIGPDGPLDCAGQKLQMTGRVRYDVNRQTWVDLQYQHELVDDSRYEGKYRQDLAAVAILTTKPHELFRLRARTRFLYEDISDNTYLERSLWSYVDVSYRLRKRDNLQFRYDLVLHLDDRMSTTTRSPSPEHWLRLEYEAYF